MTRRDRPELWLSLPTLPRVTARAAAQAEAEGWDGGVVVDSQNLGGELIVELASAVAATERLQLSPGVTNPVTRHPAVLASALASLQAHADGRMVLGIGRGDSALAHIGLAPAPVAHFEAYVTAVRAYLRGEEVPFDASWTAPSVPPVGALGLAQPPTAGALRWLRPQQSTVPVDVAATGPRVIAAGVRRADRVTFSVGASPERIGWAVEQARAAATAHGRDLPSLGAFVNVAVHDDPAVARRLVRGAVASFSRFSVMHGRPTAAASAEDEPVLQALHRRYDMTSHGADDAPHLDALDDAFVDRNAVVGDVSRCLDRLQALWRLGIDRFVVMAPHGKDPDVRRVRALLAEELLPEVQRWGPAPASTSPPLDPQELPT